MPITTFEFVSSKKESTSAKKDETGKIVEEASYLLILELSEPIDEVFGSMVVYDPELQKNVPYVSYDVTHVKVHRNILQKYNGHFTDIVKVGPNSISGKYSGDLFFDVSKDNEVFLTDTKFSAFKYERKKEYRTQRAAALSQRMKRK